MGKGGKMDPWLEGKVVVVTGGSSGIGEATVRALAKHGAETVVLDIVPAQNIPGDYLRVDVTQPKEVEGAKNQVVHKFGRVDILVNSAGIVEMCPLIQMTPEDWQRVITVNLFGTFLCCRVFAPLMVERGSGVIINVASNRGIHGMKNAAHYAASKGGVIGLTKSLAKELGPSGVRVLGVNPGITRTPLWEKTQTQEERERLIAAKKVAEPDEIAGLILLLTRPESGCLNGLILVREPLEGT
jgi:3-oxoacyl-[acyl-carrier protein] reductase